MRDLGPWDPLDRPAVWVLHEGQWASGHLLGWLRPGTVAGYAAGDGWVGLVRWYSPVTGLQHQLDLPQRWLRPRWDPEAERELPAPVVSAGEVGFVPPRMD